MTGSLLQLVAIGSEDIYFTSNPNITFYKSIYKRFSNFSMENIGILFDGNDRLSYNEPSKFYIDIPKNADLISNIFFQFDLPDIYAENNEFRWIENIGTSIINSVKFYIDNRLIEELDGVYINNYNTKKLDNLKKLTYNKLIANVENLYKPYRTVEEIYPIYENIINEKYYNTVPSIRGRKVIIPIPFWFTKHDGLELPLVALESNKIRIELELKAIRSLYTVGINETINLKASKNTNNNEIDHSNDEKYDKNGNVLYSNNTINKIKYKKADTFGEEIKNYTYLNNNDWNLNPILNVNYIFLDKPEKMVMLKTIHSYLIERLVKREYIGYKDNSVLEVELFHPSKDITLIMNRDDINETNQFSNSTNFDSIEASEHYLSYQNYYYNICYKQYELIIKKLEQLDIQFNKILESKYDLVTVINETVSIKEKRNYKPSMSDISPIQYLGLFRTDQNKSDIKIHRNDFNYTYKTIIGDDYPQITFDSINNRWEISNTVYETSGIFCPEDFYVKGKEALRNFDIYKFANIWKFRKYNEIPSINSGNYKFFSEGILNTLQIKYNGDVRQDSRDYEFFNKIQPYLYYNNSCPGSIDYSFCIDSYKYQPSGSCNFSAIKKIELILDLKNPILHESIVKNGYKYNINILTTTYNILKIENGICKLLYVT